MTYLYIWLALGLIGIITDTIKNNSDYKSLNLLSYLLYFAIFTLGGLITFGIVAYELIDD